MVPEDLEGVGDRLELQRDVWHHTDDGDDGDEGTERGALAVPGGEEVGERGDPLPPADPEDLAEYQPAEWESERRTEVDREELDPACTGPADAAVVRPRRAVDRKRQRVHRAAAD